MAQPSILAERARCFADRVLTRLFGEYRYEPVGALSTVTGARFGSFHTAQATWSAAPATPTNVFTIMREPALSPAEHGGNVVAFPVARATSPRPLTGPRRYFIHLEHSHFSVLDEVGEIIHGDEAARARVARLAAEMIALDPENSRWRQCQIALTDEAGRPLLRRPLAEMALAHVVGVEAAPQAA